MNQTDALVLILRKLNGALTPTEKAALDAWLDQDPEHRAMYARITKLHRADWESLPLADADFIAEQRSVLLQRAMNFETTRKRKDLIIRMAAVIALIMLASVFMYVVTPSPNSENKLSFAHANLDDVAEQLETVYGVSIQVDKATTGSLRFTGIFVNADLDDVLKSLRSSLPITLEHQQTRYVLQKKP